MDLAGFTVTIICGVIGLIAAARIGVIIINRH
jgi:hypothetical protein